MANRYYEPGANRAARVNDLFAAVAPRYDLINDLQSLGLHRGWKRRLVRLARGRPGERGLDLCCGTGDVAFALWSTGLETIGLDFSAPMLAVARARLKARQAKGHGDPAASGPVFIQGDALSIPFPGDVFDVVTVSYGLRNLAGWEAGLAEMCRVAKPGGRLLVLDFGKPDNALWRSVYFGYLRCVVPIFGRTFCGDAQTHAYILESLQQYPAQHGVAGEMRQLGCSDVKIINLLGGMMTINYGVKPQSRSSS
jgi:demethylmenaquinone methyltransferase/2-methoxy-6-polyprenyl-1,4-benzoquinol methylase